MLFEPIMKLLEARAQSAVSHVSTTAMALVPLLVAVGFATAAADSWLREAYGERIAFLILAATYLVIALLIYGAAREREHRKAREAAEIAETTIVSPMRELTSHFNLAGVEETLLSLVGRTGAPAAKVVAEQAARNVHLLLGAGLGIYFASRIVDGLRTRQQNRS
ncbi:MAG: hypothetical protein WAK01_12025 [Methylocystis sp.]